MMIGKAHAVSDLGADILEQTEKASWVGDPGKGRHFRARERRHITIRLRLGPQHGTEKASLQTLEHLLGVGRAEARFCR